MSVFVHNDPITIARVQSFVMQERQKCLSIRELKHRLAGYGYSLKDTEAGTVVTTLPHGIEICVLPQNAAYLFH